ncbi:MAG: hypothetical protein DWQ36_22060 [Acidobacteria bacterium]|nr:MAG: hypothetical protein DWQ30_00480 [Acidobacteriota bacterium]REK00874.1 MAG: hypothetical protein DWQ36_22060 [Acidobacteriota bacterium]
MSEPSAAVRAQAHLHHAWFLGLQLMVSARKGPGVIGEWMFRLFRRQHEARFLDGLDKLGLTGLPHAVACAQYHVLSNSVGGVGVEYLPESDRKAWVRFRYPRWMYAGPTLCGLPVEVSRGFLRGWYAHNGVSLGNPRLGFVCVSEDLLSEAADSEYGDVEDSAFGLCGYFHEGDRELAEDERLRFAPDERPPDFSLHPQPELPSASWPEERLHKAKLNYALDYLRNGIGELAGVLGKSAARQLARQSARLIGLQYQSETAAMIGAPDGDLEQAAAYLEAMFGGMGDVVERLPSDDADAAGGSIRLRHTGLRIVRGLEGAERELLLECWCELWRGAMAAQRERKRLEWQAVVDELQWNLSTAEARGR